MCAELGEVLEKAKKNMETIASKIAALGVSCEYKAAFMNMADIRGFKDKPETYQEMQIIGSTKSEVCMPLLENKDCGLIVAYHLATQFDADRERAMVLGVLDENKEKVTERNVLKAILTVRNRLYNQ